MDSTVIADQEQEAKGALSSANGRAVLATGGAVNSELPEIGVLAGQMLLFGVRGFQLGADGNGV